MSNRPWLLRTSIAFSVGTLVSLIAAGCSDSDNPAPANAADSGPADVAQKKEVAPVIEVDSSTCEPGELPGFRAPDWIPPAPLHAGRCSPTQVEALVGCLDPVDQATCDTIGSDPANQDCDDCLFTDLTAKALGPLVLTDSFVTLNIGGCIANFEGNTTAAGCGAKYDAAIVCGDEACAPNCPGNDEAAFNAYLACIDKAAAGVCEKFATPAKCADSLLKGAAAACTTGGDFIQGGIALGKLFCAAATTDGGTDAPADAPKDG